MVDIWSVVFYSWYDNYEVIIAMKKVKDLPKEKIEKITPTIFKLIEEDVYKHHLINDLGCSKKQADEIWIKISIERKKDEYAENRKEKELKEKKKMEKKLRFEK
jgi:hypothetical protein